MDGHHQCSISRKATGRWVDSPFLRQARHFDRFFHGDWSYQSMCSASNLPQIRKNVAEDSHLWRSSWQVVSIKMYERYKITFELDQLSKQQRLCSQVHVQSMYTGRKTHWLGRNQESLRSWCGKYWSRRASFRTYGLQEAFVRTNFACRLKPWMIYPR